MISLQGSSPLTDCVSHLKWRNCSLSFGELCHDFLIRLQASEVLTQSLTAVYILFPHLLCAVTRQQRFLSVITGTTHSCTSFDFSVVWGKETHLTSGNVSNWNKPEWILFTYNYVCNAMTEHFSRVPTFILWYIRWFVHHVFFLNKCKCLLKLLCRWNQWHVEVYYIDPQATTHYISSNIIVVLCHNTLYSVFDPISCKSTITSFPSCLSTIFKSLLHMCCWRSVAAQELNFLCVKNTMYSESTQTI